MKNSTLFALGAGALLLYVLAGRRNASTPAPDPVQQGISSLPFIGGVKSAWDTGTGALNVLTNIPETVGTTFNDAEEALNTAVNRAQGAAMVAAFQATGYDIRAPHVLEDFARNTMAGVKPNFETASGHQIYVPPMVILPASAPNITSSSSSPSSSRSTSVPVRGGSGASSGGGYSMVQGGTGWAAAPQIVSSQNRNVSQSYTRGTPLGYFNPFPSRR